MKLKSKIFFITILFLGLFGLAESSQAAVFFSTDWETGNPSSAWPCRQLCDGWVCDTDTFYGWHGPDYMDETRISGRSSVRKNSGAYSYYQNKPAGAASTCDLWREFTAPYPTTIYIRFYLYLGPGYNTWGSSGDPLNHWIFTNTARGSTGFRLNLTTNSHWGGCPPSHLCVLPEGDGGAEWWDNRASPSWNNIGVPNQNALNLKNYIGAWTSFEYKMQINGSNVILTEWINGVNLRGGSFTGPGSNTGNFTSIIISGWDNESTASALDFYIDDIVVSDSYIGPIEAQTDTTPPANPSGLSVN